MPGRSFFKTGVFLTSELKLRCTQKLWLPNNEQSKEASEISMNMTYEAVVWTFRPVTHTGWHRVETGCAFLPKIKHSFPASVTCAACTLQSMQMAIAPRHLNLYATSLMQVNSLAAIEVTVHGTTDTPVVPVGLWIAPKWWFPYHLLLLQLKHLWEIPLVQCWNLRHIPQTFQQ